MTYADWRGRFLEAVDEDLYPAEWLDRRVASGRARFWGNAAGAILAEVKVYAGGVKEVHGLLAAGDILAIRALIVEAEAWGRAKGCTRASISSHPAWARLLRDDGYLPSQLTIVKAL